MVLTRFDIVYDRSVSVFFPGETVSGKVIAVLDAPKSTTGIRLRLKGIGTVFWQVVKDEMVDSNDRDVPEVIDYYAEETYCSEETWLYGGPDGKTVTLTPGEHTYEFHMRLPAVLPSSFEGSYGSVRYTLTATIARSWRFDHNIRRALTVNAIVDLNNDAEARIAPHNENTKTFGFCCCQSGPLSMKFHLDKGGYVPGQEVLVTGTVNNGSDKVIKKVTARLHQVIKYITIKGTKLEQRTLSHVEREAVPPGGEQTWSNQVVHLPPIPPTNLGSGCNIMNVTYELQLDASPSGMGFDLLVTLPLLIGNIMLKQGVWHPPPGGYAPGPTVPFPTQDYPDLPSPSYSQCTFGPKSICEKDENEHFGGDKEYAPLYPVFSTSP